MFGSRVLAASELNRHPADKPHNTRAFFAVTAALLMVWTSVTEAAPEWSDRSPHSERFVSVNDVRLQYLDWGGSGPALIFIHGLSDNPHIFDDIAPAFTDRFRVIAYARRGHGDSEAKPPYDTATLTEDLRGLMDALGIARANLVGWSMGGNEITAMAVKYPDRVDRLIYLDSYDTADPDFAAAFKAIPPDLLETPASAMRSIDAFRAYQKATNFRQLNDMSRVEAYIRDLIIMQPDGTLRWRVADTTQRELVAALWSNPERDYRDVHAPILAIYASSEGDPRVENPKLRQEERHWEQKYWPPFREKSIHRLLEAPTHVQIVSVPGSHMNFFLISRPTVVRLILRFLCGQTSDGGKPAVCRGRR
jgi:pimeloyl-ACP methyl ester carboxylesterase